MHGGVERRHIHNGLTNILELNTRADGKLDVSVALTQDDEMGFCEGIDIVMTFEDIISLGHWAQLKEEAVGRRY